MRRLGRYLSYLIMTVVFLAGALAFLLPTISHIKLAVVYSGSMEPVLPVGSLAVMQRVNTAELKVGDIIAFHPMMNPELVVSHRIAEIQKEGENLFFTTKGDANEDPDIFPVTTSRVIARVTHDIPYLGYGLVEAKRYVKNRWGFVLLVCLPTLLLVGIAARDMNAALNPRTQRIKRLKERIEPRNRRRAEALNRLVSAR